MWQEVVSYVGIGGWDFMGLCELLMNMWAQSIKVDKWYGQSIHAGEQQAL